MTAIYFLCETCLTRSIIVKPHQIRTLYHRYNFRIHRAHRSVDKLYHKCTRERLVNIIEVEKARNDLSELATRTKTCNVKSGSKSLLLSLEKEEGEESTLLQLSLGGQDIANSNPSEFREGPLHILPRQYSFNAFSPLLLPKSNGHALLFEHRTFRDTI